MSESTDTERVLAEIDAAFRIPRPDWFCDARHCCECADHEDELQARNVETLDYETVGSAAWEPIAFIKNPDGFKYFMPALARLAYGRGDLYYLDLFCNNLRYDRVETFSARQRDAVEALLYDLAETITSDIEEYDDFPEVEWALRRVRGEPGPGTEVRSTPDQPG